MKLWLLAFVSLIALTIVFLTSGCGGNGGNGNCVACNGGGAGGAGSSGGGAGCIDGCPADGGVNLPPPAGGGGSARLVAYVNCLCGFGTGSRNGECAGAPDPAVNQVKQWEDDGSSPITHYVISFLSFAGGEIQTDPGEIWASGGGSTSDFTLQANLKAAMQSAQAHGKKVFLSIGGEVGSSGFLGWWSGLGGDSATRVAAMRTKLGKTASAFQQANGVRVDGFDVDIELGGVYQYNSDKYNATRDLINAVPDDLLVAFVPQVGNGLCAAPVVDDALTPPQVLGGQCQQPVNGDDSPWVLARLDKDCVKPDGSPKLDYWGIQYYNAGQADCCGGGSDATAQARSTAQNYKNLANGWPASGDTTQADNPWHQWAYYPGPWAAFAGIGADRLVLGKPGCQGCAGSDYLDLPGMSATLTQLDHQLTRPMGGILFWDLCRLFGNSGPQCVGGQCQPSWGGADVLQNLTQLRSNMRSLFTK